jgi:ribosomal protein S18 acetylase RimI-like enzyme
LNYYLGLRTFLEIFTQSHRDAKSLMNYTSLAIMKEQISKASLADVPPINQLVNSAYRGDESKKGWTTEADLLDGTRIDEAALRDLIQKPNTTILTYKEDNNLLGCVELRREGDKLYLGMLSVKPNTQGKGIGKKLLAAAEDFAKEQRCPKIFMTVISVRQELIDWYVRHGYTLTGEKKPFIVPDSRWGLPKQQLEFVVLEKSIHLY